MLLCMALVAWCPMRRNAGARQLCWCVGTLLVLGAAVVLWRFRAVVGRHCRGEPFWADLSGCNLTDREHRLSNPRESLMQRLQQTQVNLRAVVGDVRTEVRHFTSGCGNRTGSYDPSARTESQASSLEQTAASWNGQHRAVTADTAAKVSQEK